MNVMKLVRDKIPLDFPDTPADSYHTADDEEFFTALLDKLNEETVEYVAERSMDELADMLEVLHALAALDGIDWKELEQRRIAKREEKGGFDKRILWIKKES